LSALYRVNIVPRQAFESPVTPKRYTVVKNTGAAPAQKTGSSFKRIISFALTLFTVLSSPCSLTYRSGVPHVKYATPFSFIYT
jgi:hypothetical protein